MQNNRLDEAFVDKAWEEMTLILDREMPVQKRKKRFPFFILIFGALFIVMGLLGILNANVLPFAKKNTLSFFPIPLSAKKHSTFIEKEKKEQKTKVALEDDSPRISDRKVAPIEFGNYDRANFYFPSLPIIEYNSVESELIQPIKLPIQNNRIPIAQFDPVSNMEWSLLDIPEYLPDSLLPYYSTNNKWSPSFGLFSLHSSLNDWNGFQAEIGLFDYSLGKRQRWFLTTGIGYSEWQFDHFYEPGVNQENSDQFNSGPDSSNSQPASRSSQSGISVPYKNQYLHFSLAGLYRLGRRFEVGSGIEISYLVNNRVRSTNDEANYAAEFSADLTSFSSGASAVEFQKLDFGLTTQIGFRMSPKLSWHLGGHLGLSPLIKGQDDNLFRRYVKIGGRYQF